MPRERTAAVIEQEIRALDEEIAARCARREDLECELDKVRAREEAARLASAYPYDLQGVVALRAKAHDVHGSETVVREDSDAGWLHYAYGERGEDGYYAYELAWEESLDHAGRWRLVDLDDPRCVAGLEELARRLTPEADALREESDALLDQPTPAQVAAVADAAEGATLTEALAARGLRRESCGWSWPGRMHVYCGEERVLERVTAGEVWDWLRSQDEAPSSGPRRRPEAPPADDPTSPPAPATEEALAEADIVARAQEAARRTVALVWEEVDRCGTWARDREGDCGSCEGPVRRGELAKAYQGALIHERCLEREVRRARGAPRRGRLAARGGGRPADGDGAYHAVGELALDRAAAIRRRVAEGQRGVLESLVFGATKKAYRAKHKRDDPSCELCLRPVTRGELVVKKSQDSSKRMHARCVAFVAAGKHLEHERGREEA